MPVLHASLDQVLGVLKRSGLQENEGRRGVSGVWVRSENVLQASYQAACVIFEKKMPTT